MDHVVDSAQVLLETREELEQLRAAVDAARDEASTRLYCVLSITVWVFVGGQITINSSGEVYKHVTFLYEVFFVSCWERNRREEQREREACLVRRFLRLRGTPDLTLQFVVFE